MNYINKYFNKSHVKKGRVVTVVIPCHNQDEIVKLNIDLLNKQSVPPDYILVIDDHSTKFTIRETQQVRIHHLDKRGRVHNRNKGIDVAMELGSDLVIFMDGDTIPSDSNYIYNYIKNDTDKPLMIFGMRTHVKSPKRLSDFNFKFDYEEIEVEKWPSDLLTANLDKKRNFKNTDLRIVAGITDVFNDIKDFDEKANMIASGLVTWSCNFMMTKEAAKTLKSFMKKTYDIDGYFDYNEFSSGWGGEDNAFGMDSHFADIEIQVSIKSQLLHFMHERTDKLFTHVKLNNTMLNRLMQLQLKRKKYIK